MATNITFKEDSKEAILKLASTSAKNKSIFVLVDVDDSYNKVVAALNPKTFLGTLVQSISDELCLNDDDELKTILLKFQKHDYSIECECTCVIDAEEETRNFNITPTSFYK